MPKLISCSGTETKYRPENGQLQETLNEEEEEADDKNEEVIKDDDDGEADADDEAELTDVRKDKDTAETNPVKTTEKEDEDDLVENKGS